MKKSDHQLRWVILFLNCTMLFGVYYTYDMPAALKTKIEDHMGSPDNFETLYGLLYSFSSFPNVILPFIGGHWVDRMGARSCLLLFTSTLALGHIVFCFGLSMKSWPIMYAGRFIFGCGQTTNVANSTMLSDWFGGKELAFSFAINVAFARMGSSVNNIASPAIAASTGVVMSFWIGGILVGGTVLSAVLIFPMDARLDAMVAKDEEGLDSVVQGEGASQKLLKQPEEDDVEEGEAEEEEHLRLSDVFKLPYILRVITLSVMLTYGCVVSFNNVASTLFLERDFFKVPPDECHLLYPGSCQNSTNVPVDCPSSSHYQPPLPVDITYDGVYYAELESSDIDCSDDLWKDGCTEHWCDRYDSAIIDANTIMSIPYFMAAILFPVFGYVVDVYGQRGSLITMSAVLLLVVHLLLGLTTMEPISLMIGQGLSYTMFASAMWPCLPLVVDKKFLGIAYGVAFSIQNIGLSTFPLVIAQIYGSSGDEYIPNVEFFFCSMAAMGVLNGLYLCYIDRKYFDSVLQNFVVGSDNDASEDASDKRDSLLKREDGIRTSSHSRNSLTARRRQSHQSSFSSTHSVTF